MNQLVQEAVLIRLAKQLGEAQSWTGETHLQKASYLLSKLRRVDFEFDFILYKYGPFSFELREELSSMCAEGLLETVVPNPRYGPMLRVTEDGTRLEQSFPKAMNRYGEDIAWIAGKLGSSGVADLERLATAMWMTDREPDGASVSQRATAIIEVKPHISLEDASASVGTIDEWLADSKLAA